MPADSMDAKTRKILASRVEKGKEAESYQSAEKQLLAIQAKQQENLMEARMNSQAARAQNEIMAQAAQVAMDGSDQPQMVAVPGAVNPATQQIMSRYGVGQPKFQRSQSHSTQVTKQNIIINNNTTNQTTNNVSVPAGAGGPLQGRPLQFKNPDPNGSQNKFKVWLSQAFAKQDAEAKNRERVYERRESSLTRSANKMMRKLEDIGKTMSERLDPRSIGTTLTSQLKVLGFLFGLHFLSKNWKSILKTVNKIQVGFEKFTDWLGFGKNNTGESGLVQSIKYMLGGKEAGENRSILELIRDIFYCKDENHPGLYQIFVKYFDTLIDDRKEALKAVTGRAAKESGSGGLFGKFVNDKILGGIGQMLGGVTSYLGDILTALISGTSGITNILNKKNLRDTAKNTGTAGSATTKTDEWSSYYKNAGNGTGTSLGDLNYRQQRKFISSADIDKNGQLTSGSQGAIMRQSNVLVDALNDRENTRTGDIMAGFQRMETFLSNIDKNTRGQNRYGLVSGDFMSSLADRFGISTNDPEWKSILLEAKKHGGAKIIRVPKTDAEFKAGGGGHNVWQDIKEGYVTGVAGTSAVTGTIGYGLGGGSGAAYGAGVSVMNPLTHWVSGMGSAVNSLWNEAVSNDDRYIYKLVHSNDPLPKGASVVRNNISEYGLDTNLLNRLKAIILKKSGYNGDSSSFGTDNAGAWKYIDEYLSNRKGTSSGQGLAGNISAVTAANRRFKQANAELVEDLSKNGMVQGAFNTMNLMSDAVNGVGIDTNGRWGDAARNWVSSKFYYENGGLTNYSGNYSGNNSWPQAVQIMAAWYVNNIPNYSQSAYYDCPLIGRKVRADCSGFVSACLILYGFDTPILNSTELGKDLSSAGFRKSQYSLTSLQPFDIIVNPGKHVAIFAGTDKSGKPMAYDWGNKREHLPIRMIASKYTVIQRCDSLPNNLGNITYETASVPKQTIDGTTSNVSTNTQQGKDTITSGGSSSTSAKFRYAGANKGSFQKSFKDHLGEEQFDWNGDLGSYHGKISYKKEGYVVKNGTGYYKYRATGGGMSKVTLEEDDKYLNTSVALVGDSYAVGMSSIFQKKAAAGGITAIAEPDLYNSGDNGARKSGKLSVSGATINGIMHLVRNAIGKVVNGKYVSTIVVFAGLNRGNIIGKANFEKKFNELLNVANESSVRVKPKILLLTYPLGQKRKGVDYSYVKKELNPAIRSFKKNYIELEHVKIKQFDDSGIHPKDYSGLADAVIKFLKTKVNVNIAAVVDKTFKSAEAGGTTTNTGVDESSYSSSEDGNFGSATGQKADVIAYAVQHFINKGYTPEQAAGIVGNLMGEGLLTKDYGNIYQLKGEAHKTMGIAGFYGAELGSNSSIGSWQAQQLKAYAESTGKNINTLGTQLDFLTDVAIPGSIKSGRHLENLSTATSVADSAHVWGHEYERFAGYEVDPSKSENYKKRISMGNDALAIYNANKGNIKDMSGVTGIGGGSYSPGTYTGESGSITGSSPSGGGGSWWDNIADFFMNLFPRIWSMAKKAGSWAVDKVGQGLDHLKSAAGYSPDKYDGPITKDLKFYSEYAKAAIERGETPMSELEWREAVREKTGDYPIDLGPVTDTESFALGGSAGTTISGTSKTTQETLSGYVAKQEGAMTTATPEEDFWAKDEAELKAAMAANPGANVLDTVEIKPDKKNVWAESAFGKFLRTGKFEEEDSEKSLLKQILDVLKYGNDLTTVGIDINNATARATGAVVNAVNQGNSIAAAKGSGKVTRSKPMLTDYEAYSPI